MILDTYYKKMWENADEHSWNVTVADLEDVKHNYDINDQGSIIPMGDG